jgi:cystathionine beta-synthase
MTTNLQTTSPRARLQDLLPIFDAGMVAIVAENGDFHGLITPVDVLSYLCRHRQES